MNHADTRIDLDQLGSDTEGFAELCVGVAVVDSIPIDLAKRFCEVHRVRQTCHCRLMRRRTRHPVAGHVEHCVAEVLEPRFLRAQEPAGARVIHGHRDGLVAAKRWARAIAHRQAGHGLVGHKLIAQAAEKSGSGKIAPRRLSCPPTALHLKVASIGATGDADARQRGDVVSEQRCQIRVPTELVGEIEQFFIGNMHRLSPVIESSRIAGHQRGEAVVATLQLDHHEGSSCHVGTGG